MTPPPKVGRIPRKIQSGFAAFTADEWKNWIVLYSPYILRDLLPERDYECWCHFVEACQLVCQPILNREQINLAHDLIVKFCTTYEELYGKDMCTPNMHMACHLKDIMLDYGPVHGYWCFSFERYNGILEAMNKSWVNPEKQLLFKFLDLQFVNTIAVTTSENDFISLVCSDITKLRNMSTNRTSGSVCQMAYESFDLIQQLTPQSGPTCFIDPKEKPYHGIIQPFFEKCLTDEELEYIKHVYKAVYPNCKILNISRFCKEFKTLVINGEEYISEKSRSQRSPTIFAHWPSMTGRIDTTGDAPYQIGNVQSFLCHQVTFENEGSSQSVTALLALVKWYEEHPRRNSFHRSIIVCGTLFRPMCNASFIPVARIMGRCTTCKTHYQFDYGQDRITIAVPSSPIYMS